MNFGFSFFFTNILLGIGLAMVAFSVSLANGLNEPDMKKQRMGLIAGVFAIFQLAMPMIGWVLVSNAAKQFETFEKCIPWIALLLLGIIGGKMLFEGIRYRAENTSQSAVGIKGLMVQGVATSIDALSVGFTISGYNIIEAFCACLLIGIVTFVICCLGLAIGKKAGMKLAGKAGILGGAILIFIGLEIFIKGI